MDLKLIKKLQIKLNKIYKTRIQTKSQRSSLTGEDCGSDIGISRNHNHLENDVGSNRNNSGIDLGVNKNNNYYSGSGYGSGRSS